MANERPPLTPEQLEKLDSNNTEARQGFVNNPFAALTVGPSEPTSAESPKPPENVSAPASSPDSESIIKINPPARNAESVTEGNLPLEADKLQQETDEEKAGHKNQPKEGGQERRRERKSKSEDTGKGRKKRSAGGEKSPPSGKSPTSRKVFSRDYAESYKAEGETSTLNQEKTLLQKELELKKMRVESAFARLARYLKTGERLPAQEFLDQVRKLNALRRVTFEAEFDGEKFKGYKGCRTETRNGAQVAETVMDFLSGFKDEEFRKRPFGQQRRIIMDFISSFPDVTTDARNFRDGLVKALINEGVLTSEFLPKNEVRQSSKAEDDKEFERVMADVGRAENLERTWQGRTFHVSGSDVARDIRRLARIFQGGEFRVKPYAERERQILEALDLLTTDQRLRDDLKKIFERRGWLMVKSAESVGDTVKTGASLPEAKSDRPEVAERPAAPREPIPPAPTPEPKTAHTETTSAKPESENVPDGNSGGEKSHEPETFAEIIAEVRKYPKKFKIIEGGKPLEFSPAEMERVLLAYVVKIQSDKFQAKPREERNKEIIADLNTIDHALLRSDLRKLFERNGWLRPVASEVSAGAPVPIEKKKETMSAAAVFKRHDLMGGQSRGQETVELPPENIDYYMRTKNARRPVKITPPPPFKNIPVANPVKNETVPVEPSASEARKEEKPPAPPSAPKAPEAVKVAYVKSPDQAAAKAVLEDSGGFDIGKAMDVPGFAAFLAEAEKLGQTIDMADKENLKDIFEAFARKDSVAEEVYKVHAERISKDLGLSLDDAGKQAVREHLERQAHESPRLIKQLFTKFEHLKVLPGEIAGLEAQVAELKKTLTPEGQAKLRESLEGEHKRIKEERDIMALALKSNAFWTGAGSFHSLNWFAQKLGFESSETYKARKIVKEKGAKSKFSPYALIGGLSTEKLESGMVLKEERLRGVENQLASLESEFKKGAADKDEQIKRLDEQRFKAHQILENAKLNLFRDSELDKKLAGMAWEKIVAEIYSFHSAKEEDQTAEAAAKASELFEKTLRASLERGGGEGDYLAGVDVKETQEKIDGWLTAGIRTDVGRAVSRALALSAGRFKALEGALAKLTEKEKLGSKSRAEVRRHIVERLFDELEIMADEPKDENTEKGRKRVQENKEKTLHIRAIIVKQEEALRAGK